MRKNWRNVDWEPKTSHLTSAFCQECVVAPHPYMYFSATSFLISFILCDSITIVSFEFNTLLHNTAVCVGGEGMGGTEWGRGLP